MNENACPEIIELKSYYDPIQANLEKELLEKEGIRCYLQNENIARGLTPNRIREYRRYNFLHIG